MILIVGLGNPGEEFKNTRHNLGFEIVDIIHSSFTFPKFSKKFDGVFAKKNIYDNNVILFKPMNFMNLSGAPVYKIFDFFNIEKVNNLIVFHDDLDLVFSKLRIKKSGGHGGHNGVKNIIKFFGENFYRIKVGIKSPLYTENDIPADKFVLGNFSTKELSELEILKRKIVENFQSIINKNFNILISKV